jgi:hypothetical protein
MDHKDIKAFEGRLDAWEDGPWTTNFAQLTAAGIDLPHPDTLDDTLLTAKLWEVIFALANLRVFLDQTDHLSDRELYTVLWNECLRHEVPDLPPHPDEASHVEMLGGWSNEDILNYLRYYADEDEREHWRRDCPDQEMPPHEDPPYDRDRMLPAP